VDPVFSFAELGYHETAASAYLTGLRKQVMDPAASARVSGAGSDDIAEVSWNLPTVVLRFPGNIPGMIGHHWSSGIAMAHALTAIDLLTNPELLGAARKYFAEQTSKTKWKSLIPADTPPPVWLNRDKMEKFRPELDKLRYDPSKFSTYMEQLGIVYPTVRE
jgi:aminobenzoyl-glutamate utilization protein B